MAFLPFSLPMGKILLVILIVAIALFSVISLVLFYHWRTYGMSNKKIAAAEALYLSVSFLFIGLAVFALVLH